MNPADDGIDLTPSLRRLLWFVTEGVVIVDFFFALLLLAQFADVNCPVISCSAARSTLNPHALKHADRVLSSTFEGTNARNMANLSTTVEYPPVRDILENDAALDWCVGGASECTK